jgi:signal peptidase I
VDRPPPASELSGSLGMIGFVPLVQFLSSLGKSGSLRVWRDHWVAEVGFERGNLVAATADDEQGTDALDFILLALAEGEFSFASGPPPAVRNLDQPTEALHAYLERLATARRSEAAALISPVAVPRLAEPPDTDPDAEVVLTRRSLHVLLEVDGRRTVEEIGRRRGRSSSVKELIRLVDLGLISLAPGAASAGPAGPPETRPPQPPPGGGPTGRRLPTERPPADRSNAEQSRQWWQRGRSAPFRALGTEVLQGVAVTAALVLGARAVVQNFRVDGTSMEPNFSAGQVLVVNKAAYYHVEGSPLDGLLPATSQGSLRYPFGGPERGDVVVFHAPTEPGTDFIKRVIGLPGDRVQIEAGRVLVNGQPLAEPEIRFRASYTYPADGRPLVVPDDSYFVLGDNRPISYDSHLGWVVPASDLVGQAWVRYWPPSDWRLVPRGGLADPSLPSLQAAESAARQ